MQSPTAAELAALLPAPAILQATNLHAGYGQMEILHGIDLMVAPGQSLCLIGPNGAGKSTVLHALYHLCDIYQGHITKHDQDITSLAANEKLLTAKIAYVLQDSSIFPDMTVAENIAMGAYLLKRREAIKQKVEFVFDNYPRLANKQHQRAKVLSGGERRLLEISRALMLDPDILLIDEPSIGLEPKYIDLVFDMLKTLQQDQGKAIVLVEQNAKKALAFADIGYVLVAGRIALAGTGDALLENPTTIELFLGGKTAKPDIA